MEKLNSILVKVLDFIDRYATLIILGVAAYLFADKLGVLFSAIKKSSDDKEKALVEHDQALLPAVKQPLPADPLKRPAVARANVQAAEVKLQAEVAEKIHKNIQPGWIAIWERRSALLETGAQMKKFKVSLAGVEKQYKLLSGKNLFTEMRAALGDDYFTWLTNAGTIK